MTREMDCLNQMRDVYAQFSGLEISAAIKIIRCEMTKEEDRSELQKKILEDHAKLASLNK